MLGMRDDQGRVSVWPMLWTRLKWTKSARQYSVDGQVICTSQSKRRPAGVIPFPCPFNEAVCSEKRYSPGGSRSLFIVVYIPEPGQREYRDQVVLVRKLVSLSLHPSDPLIKFVHRRKVSKNGKGSWDGDAFVMHNNKVVTLISDTGKRWARLSFIARYLTTLLA